MSAVVIWIILKVLFWIGVGAVALYFLFFTEDGRELLKWIAGIGAALGIGALIFVLIGAGIVWILYKILMMFL
tara:strand:- start:7 stop:225 length:219 start_codon:yes stop_codon:yes gene_type:complete